MVEITKEFIRTNIYKTFYDIVNTNASSVTFGTKTYTLKTIDQSFNERVIDLKENYPIVILSDIETPSKQFTIGLTEIEGRIDINVFATSAKEAMLFTDKISYEIELKKAELKSFGLHEIDIEETDEGSNQRGQFNSHFRVITIMFTYKYPRTRA